MRETGTRWLDTEQQRAWRALVLGTTLLMDRLDDDLRAGFKLSLTEYEVLVRLSERPTRSMRMAQIADALAHSRSRVTHTVERMEKQGYVARTASPEDGRGVVATLSDTGLAVLQEAAHLHVEGVRAHLVDLVDPDDLAALGRAMDAVADRLIGSHPEMEIRPSRA